MIGGAAVVDARVLLGAGWRAQRRALRRAAPEQAAVILLVGLACCWAVRLATHDVLEATPAGRLAQSLGTVSVVTGMLLTASAFSSSSALRRELAAVAHRVGGRGVQLSRSVTATGLGAVGTALLVGLLVVGSPLTGAQVVRLLGWSLPGGVVLGCGLAVAVEAAVRRWVPGRTALGAGRFALCTAVLLAAAALVGRPGWTPWLVGAAAAAWTAVLGCGGLAPVRPEWLTRRSRVRRPGLGLVRAAAASPRWHPVVLLWRDPLCGPAAAGLVALVGVAAAVGRVPAAGSLADLYVALWPLLVIVPASSLGLVALAKTNPLGGGLVGHRVGARTAVLSALLCSTVCAVSITLGGSLVASVAGAAWMAPAELARFAVTAGIASALALGMAAVRTVPAAAIDLPASTSLGHLGAGSVVVGALSGAGWAWVVGSLAVAAPAVVVSLTLLTRGRAPFTR